MIKTKLLLLVFALAVTSATAKTVVVPEDFSWKQIPESWSDQTIEIKYHYNPRGVDVVLPDRVTLRFNGGSLKGIKSLTGNQITIRSSAQNILDPKTIFQGSFVHTKALPEWFGAKGDNQHNDATAVKAAVEAFPEVLFQQQYFVPGINIVIREPVTLKGNKQALIRGDGSSSGRFTVKNSITVADLTFSNFRFCFFFDHDDTIDGVVFRNNRFREIDKPIMASNSNMKQKLLRVEITDNHFSQCSSGVDLLAWVRYVSVCRNTFADLGHPTLEAQSNAIRIGNTAFNYHKDTQMGDISVCNNTITNVRTGTNTMGRDGYECHAVFVVGNRIEILDNHIEKVFNGGFGNNPRNKSGSEAIYVKGNHCLIKGNTLIDAGFGEGAICVKDFGKNITIAYNTIHYVHDEADHGELITCYYAGNLVIENNILQSAATATTAIKLCSRSLKHSSVVIQNNPKVHVNGYVLKVMNQGGISDIAWLNNTDIQVTGLFLKEESTKQYILRLENNQIKVINGIAVPSTKFNDLTFSNNTVTLQGIGQMHNIHKIKAFQRNTFHIEASAPNLPLFNFHMDGQVMGNHFLVQGAWRNILMIRGMREWEIQDNRFELSGSANSIARVIFLNASVKEIVVSITGNRFNGSPGQENAILISVSNAGVNQLNMHNNQADAGTGVMLEILSEVESAVFTRNRTQSRSGFASTTSVSRISGGYRASRNAGLPDRK
jgi:hypothetical protein